MGLYCPHSDVPDSDELTNLTAVKCRPETPESDQILDDLDAVNAIAAEVNRRGIGPVAHKIWKTSDVFRSEPDHLTSSQELPMPLMPSSPPPSPTSQKRKFTELDLGNNTLERAPKLARAQRSYYGINIHALLEEAQAEERIAAASMLTNATLPSTEPLQVPTPPSEKEAKRTLLWTEKYRARKFTDLIGDERTHRSVMHWLKRWDPIVFPGSSKPSQRNRRLGEQGEEECPLRKILMLTGPPGLGKTTLAHVCARQAGYEVQEINASDERSRDVVKGRIRDMVGTENVKAVDTKRVNGKIHKAGKPVCVVVDEVDGVVSGSGGGEGGFIKALIDLVALDQKNSMPLGSLQQAPAKRTKGDRFRQLRPLILICNDIYHPSLRPLRQTSIAEVIHVRKPAVQKVAARMHAIFEREGIPADADGVRRLCEATWGISNRKEDRSGSGTGEGDVRGIMVVAEWAAGKLRTSKSIHDHARLTRRWFEDHILKDLQQGGNGARGVGRGGAKDIVERVFLEGAGFPKSIAPMTPGSSAVSGTKGVAEGHRRTSLQRLQELIDTYGDTDRIMTDCFSTYADFPFQDDTLLSKPDSAYDWLHFHDCLSNALYSSNEWELAPYLSTPILAFHSLFASQLRRSTLQAEIPTDEDASPLPFSGSQASWAAHEALKHNEAQLQTIHDGLCIELNRSFNSHHAIATDLLPYLLRMVSPNVSPVIIGSSKERSMASVRKASEQLLVQRSVNAMGASGVRFERTKVTPTDADGGASWGQPSWIYRMEPPLDTLSTFETGGKGFGANAGKTRYAVRQVLEQEWQKEEKRRAEASRMARLNGGVPVNAVKAVLPPSSDNNAIDATTRQKVRRDFFGRPLAVVESSQERKEESSKGSERERTGRIWVTYNEGFSNAVRKPITLADLMKDL